MRLKSHIARFAAPVCLLVACLLPASCDTVEPVSDDLLVVEGFLEAGKPLPAFTLRRTQPLSAPYPDDETTSVQDAEVLLTLDGMSFHCRPVPGAPGRYAPDTQGPLLVPGRAAFALQVRWREQVAAVQGSVPPPVAIDSVQLSVPDKPVEAVLLDSLRIVPDSLGTGARKGFIYPIEVRLWWTVGFDEGGADSLYWIRTQLKPITSFSSTVIDFFLRPEQILRERDMPLDARSRRSWTGVYAVPVDKETDPLPVHRLKVSLLRSGQDYARFASSRDAPDRREPVSNVQGAIGIVAGIALDSVQVQVE